MKPWEKYAAMEKETQAPQEQPEGPWTKYQKMDSETKETPAPQESQPVEEEWSTKLERFLGDLGDRVDSGVDSVSDIGLPFTDESLGEVVLGREPSGRRQIFPQEAALQVAGTTVGALGDTIGAGVEALTPDSWGVGPALQKKVVQGITALNETEVGSKAIALAMDGVEGWKAFEAKYPQYAKSIGSAANLASIITPSTGATKAVVGGVGKGFGKGGKAVTDSALNPKKAQIKNNLLGEVENRVGRGQTEPGMLPFTSKYNPTDFENKQIDALSNVPGIKPDGAKHANLIAVTKELDNKYKELDEVLKGGPDVPRAPVKSQMQTWDKKGGVDADDYLEMFEGTDGLAGDADAAMFNKVLKRARTMVEKSDGTAAGMNRARKEFDKAYNFNFNDRDKANYIAYHHARNIMNEAVDDVVPGAKQLRTDTISPLMSSKEEIGSMAAKEAPHAIGRIANYVKSSGAVPTSALSLFAVASSIWAPWALGAAGTVYLGKLGIKGVKNSAQVRRALGATVSGVDKAIKKAESSGATKAVLDDLKADRLFLIDMMQIKQEGEE
jgi:hypothetical protein